ncbi:CheR family methyltransferase [Magnetospirillum molischianum]|uniref:Putative Methylase of chemotaxis methyl-accepting protein n=1 Tax=Magnetospirillum molischianum DSM 120 TaxID=1150626 RepID=H8FRG8_MAGML|nr:protein-glutamate O-methyltransferase CheR [Magnetospirillum molischianum]CCG40956.1 Putative Methylase of chemotaxis methyl-accepting protein [Magnetospirillum molischianum DSM 120]
MTPEEVQDIEIGLFLEALQQRHGYDFRHYARPSMRRRLLAFASSLGHSSLSELIPRLLHDNDFLPQILTSLSVPVTSMFRDPEVFLALRRTVLPVLESYPRISIWQAGCATGEEAYSLAILLKEEGLLPKTQIFATDINDGALARAEEGIYSAKTVLSACSVGYRAAGGTGALEDHLHFAYGYAKFNDELRSKIVFAHHNLVADGVFCEVHMVVCRNVLIYFDRVLQQQVLSLFSDALIRGGFLCLGTRETLESSESTARFRTVNERCRIFRKAEAHQ